MNLILPMDEDGAELHHPKPSSSTSVDSEIVLEFLGDLEEYASNGSDSNDPPVSRSSRDQSTTQSSDQLNPVLLNTAEQCDLTKNDTQKRAEDGDNDALTPIETKFAGHDIIQDPSHSPIAKKRKHQEDPDRTASPASPSSATSSSKISNSQLRRKKKPNGMPKRPLSAYNLYFQSERARLLLAVERGELTKLGFEGLGKIIGKNWKALSAEERKKYDELASIDGVRYRKEMNEYKKKKEESRVCQPPEVDGDHHYSPPSAVSFAHHDHEDVPEELHPPRLLRRVSSYPPRQEIGPYGNMNTLPPRREQSSHWSRHLSHGQSPHRPPFHHHYPSSYLPNPPPRLDFPVPPGMEILLPDRMGVERKYRVEYSYYSMSREEANQFMERLSRGSFGRPESPPPVPAPPPPTYRPFVASESTQYPPASRSPSGTYRDSARDETNQQPPGGDWSEV